MRNSHNQSTPARTVVQTLDPSSVTPMYAMRFTDRILHADEDTVEHDMTIHELHRLDEAGELMPGRGGMDFQRCESFQLFCQDEVAPGNTAWCVISSYAEIEYTFASDIGLKQVVAVCASEGDAWQWRDIFYRSGYDGDYTAHGLPGWQCDDKFDVVALSVH